MDAPASDYHHGDQDPSMQVATYRSFIGLTKWGGLAISIAVLTLSIWFCTDSGFMAGFITGLVALVLGVFFLRAKSGSGQ